MATSPIGRRLDRGGSTSIVVSGSKLGRCDPRPYGRAIVLTRWYPTTSRDALAVIIETCDPAACLWCTAKKSSVCGAWLARDRLALRGCLRAKFRDRRHGVTTLAAHQQGSRGFPDGRGCAALPRRRPSRLSSIGTSCLGDFHEHAPESGLRGQQHPQRHRRRRHALPHRHMGNDAVHRIGRGLRHALRAAREAEPATLAAEGQQPVVPALAGALPQDAMRRDAALGAGVEPVLDRPIEAARRRCRARCGR